MIKNKLNINNNRRKSDFNSIFHYCAGFILACAVCFGIIFGQWQTVLAQKPNWADKQLRLIEETGAFIEELKAFQRDDGSLFSETSFYKADDEVEYFYYLPAYSYISNDPVAYDFYSDEVMYYWNRIMNADANDGYFGDPTYDTEHTLEALMGLANLALIDANDTKITSRLEDLVEHVGNWDSGVPDWYNPSTKHLLTMKLGTKSIYQGCPEGIDSPWNLRFANMVIAAYLDNYNTQNNNRYNSWLGSFLDSWIDAKNRNVYDVIPSSVNPDDGSPGHCGEWYQGVAGSWSDGGFASARSCRQAFLGYWMLSKQEKYINAAKEMVVELFNQGDGTCPASVYNGTSWEVSCDDDHIARLAIQSALQDGEDDTSFDSRIDNWVNSASIDEPITDIWKFRKTGDINIIVNKHLSPALNKIIAKRNQLSSIDDRNGDGDVDADDLVDYLVGNCSGKNIGDKLIACFSLESQATAIAFSAFGGLRPNEADLPWMEVKYFKSDGSLGLPAGVAALVTAVSDTFKKISLYNDNKTSQTVRIQAEFLAKTITGLKINGQNSSSFNSNYASILIAPDELLEIEILTAGPSSREDINLDGKVDILDIQLCVNVFLDGGTDPDIVARADVNKDGIVNILDIQRIVNKILG